MKLRFIGLVVGAENFPLLRTNASIKYDKNHILQMVTTTLLCLTHDNPYGISY